MATLSEAVQVNIPCPACDYSLAQLDRCRDACRYCGLIVPNERRAELFVRRTFRARDALVKG